MIKIKMLYDFLYEYIVFHATNIRKMSLLFCINQLVSRNNCWISDIYTVTIFEEVITQKRM